MRLHEFNNNEIDCYILLSRIQIGPKPDRIHHLLVYYRCRVNNVHMICVLRCIILERSVSKTGSSIYSNEY
jgi:hypothetical protein